ncbi:hypothetical protein GCM10025868_34710 [Angustibacter aerolatus]|uniref:Galactokinase N-terminal domain-containing protein n=1 Tax=Angustibacter aerolatus TaxID=1162965 RepID=A0ABQ6JNG5_9ACTN|nr:hypothetical protein GCM10025868_34710 [Angustibacter aerolatus]
MSGLTWHACDDEHERAARLQTAFRDAYGVAPEGVWAAPGRVNLVGEHVDYVGGLCLPFALPHTTLVAAGGVDGADGTPPQARGPLGAARRRRRPRRAVGRRGGHPGGWGAYVAGAAAVLAERRPEALSSARLLLDSQVPVGAGLSSSAALSCGSAVALDALWRTGLLDAEGGRTEPGGRRGAGRERGRAGPHRWHGPGRGDALHGRPRAAARHPRRFGAAGAVRAG